MAWGYGKNRFPESVWIHAVSVGEVLAAAPMIEQLLAEYPAMPLVVTTTTPTGSERVQALFQDRVTHVYCPWEVPDALLRFFRAFNPKLVIVLETELWPNLCAAAKCQGAKLMLMNGRLSEKSYRGYARVPRLVKPMLARFDVLAVQTEAEAARFEALGADPACLHATGSVKFDLTLDDAVKQDAAALREQFGQRPVWIAASTHPGEDDAVLAAHARVRERHSQALLVLVPRHPERFADVAQQIIQAGFTLARRSQADPVTENTAVYLADTMGELLMLFGAVDLAFVGGSLVPVGGHNLLEPAAWQKPVLTGPHWHNFIAIVELLEQAGGLTHVQEGASLGDALVALFDDRDRQARQGQAAASVVAANRGALQRGLALIDGLWPGK